MRIRSTLPESPLRIQKARPDLTSGRLSLGPLLSVDGIEPTLANIAVVIPIPSNRKRSSKLETKVPGLSVDDSRPSTRFHANQAEGLGHPPSLRPPIAILNATGEHANTHTAALQNAAPGMDAAFFCC